MDSSDRFICVVALVVLMGASCGDRSEVTTGAGDVLPAYDTQNGVVDASRSAAGSLTAIEFADFAKALPLGVMAHVAAPPIRPSDLVLTSELVVEGVIVRSELVDPPPHLPGGLASDEIWLELDVSVSHVLAGDAGIADQTVTIATIAWAGSSGEREAALEELSRMVQAGPTGVEVTAFLMRGARGEGYWNPPNGAGMILEDTTGTFWLHPSEPIEEADAWQDRQAIATEVQNSQGSLGALIPAG